MTTATLLSLGQEEVWRFFGFAVALALFLGMKMGRGFANQVFVLGFFCHFCREMVNNYGEHY